VRGVACLLVLVWHYFGATVAVAKDHWAGPAWQAFGKLGLSGVDLFFVLSGFLIGGILFDHRDSPNYFKTFYVRRVCRIFPIYYLIFLAMCVLMAVGARERFSFLDLWLWKDMMPLWSYATFTQNVSMAFAGHAGGKWLAMTWSVAVEEQFYMLFPLVVWALPRRAVIVFLIATVFFAPVCRVLVAERGVWFYTLLPCRTDCLTLGVLTAFVVRQPAAVAWLRRNLWFHRGLIAGAFGLVVLVSVATTKSLWVILTYHTWVALVYAGVILLVTTRPESPVSAVCRNRTLGWIGLISYGVYMFHQLVQGLCHGAILHQVPAIRSGVDLAVTVLAVGLTFGLATVSFYGMERHLLRLGKRVPWAPARRPEPAVVDAPPTLVARRPAA